MKMEKILAIIIFACLTGVQAGRLVQEDPSWSKTPTKVLVRDAPDDYVGRRNSIRQSMVGASLTTESSPVQEPSSHPTTVPVITSTVTVAGRTKRKFIPTLTPALRQRRLGKKHEVVNHRLMQTTGKGNDILSSTDPNSMFAISKDLEENQGEIPRGKRQFPLWTSYPPHQLDLDRFFFMNKTFTTPKYPYGVCRVSLGFDTNPACLTGEVCVDKDTLQKIDCPNGPATPCPACTAGTPAPPCPRGCPPGSMCPPITTPEDGVCTDPTREDEEYDLTYELSSTRRTPSVFYSGTLGKGASCSVYGDLADETEKSDLDFAEKAKKLRTSSDSGNLGGSMCNWAQARLQCIPSKPRLSTTTAKGTQLTEADIEASKRPSGTCECMLALGEKATALEDQNTGQMICYIPANKGTHSNCDHEIYPPHGALEGVRKDGNPFHRSSEPAARFCVPNSECRAGYKYTGLRCQCKKKARWDPRTFTCSRAIRQRFGHLSRMVTILGGIYLAMVKFY